MCQEPGKHMAPWHLFCCLRCVQVVTRAAALSDGDCVGLDLMRFYAVYIFKCHLLNDQGSVFIALSDAVIKEPGFYTSLRKKSVWLSSSASLSICQSSPVISLTFSPLHGGHLSLMSPWPASWFISKALALLALELSLTPQICV